MAARLSWTTPSNGGTQITGYRIRRNGVPLVAIRVANAYVDAAARPGDRYEVAAVNRLGTGPYSEVQSFAVGSRTLAGYAIPGTHLAFMCSQHELDAEMALVAAANCAWVRFDVAAVQIESAPGVRDWSNIDRIVNSALAHGLMPQAILTTLPAWAGSDWQMGPVTAEQYTAFTDFARAAVERYRGKIHVWEVWNEPNSPVFWTDPSVSAYTALLRATHSAVKSVDPGATVLLGGPAGGQSGVNATSSWYAGLYANGAKGFFDAANMHPYPATFAEGPASGEMRHIAAVRATMSEHGDAHLPIWATEIGFPTGGWNSVTEAQQAAFAVGLHDNWVAATGSQRGPLMVYALRDMTYKAPDREAHFGTVRDDFTLKPAYEALKAWNAPVQAGAWPMTLPPPLDPVEKAALSHSSGRVGSSWPAPRTKGTAAGSVDGGWD